MVDICCRVPSSSSWQDLKESCDYHLTLYAISFGLCSYFVIYLCNISRSYEKKKGMSVLLHLHLFNFIYDCLLIFIFFNRWLNHVHLFFSLIFSFSNIFWGLLNKKLAFWSWTRSTFAHFLFESGQLLNFIRIETFYSNKTSF